MIVSAAVRHHHAPPARALVPPGGTAKVYDPPIDTIDVASAFASFPDAARERLVALHAASEFDAVIGAADAAAIADAAGIDVAQLMTKLLPAASLFARPPVSRYRVGCVSRGATTGALYYGANLEFSGEALSFTVHAEQSSVTNAWGRIERGVDLIAVTAAPCGYCRQFLNELVTADRLVIAMPSATLPLSRLLPGAFGPRDLGIEGGLMQEDEHPLAIDLDDTDDLAQATAVEASFSYAPYSQAFAAVGLRFADGTIVTGGYAENAAFNPSMSPLQVALSRANLRGQAFDAIRDAVLVSTGPLHDQATRIVLSTVSETPLRILRARNADPASSR